MSLSVVAGVQLAPEWRSQISKAPSGTWRVQLTQRSEAEGLQGRAATPGLAYGFAAGSCFAGG